MFSNVFQFDETTTVLFSLFVMLLSGFLATRLTNFMKLPKVTGFIVAGILIGPDALGLIPGDIRLHMGFLSDVALVFIAFGVGRYFKKATLMKTGASVLVITIFEALTAGVLVTLVVGFCFPVSWDFALLLGAIATATAPASTVMTIRQYKVKGPFVNALLQVVALDDVVCLLTFSVVAAIADARTDGHLSLIGILLPVFYNLVALGLGVLCALVLSRLMTPQRSKDTRLILAITMLLGMSALCAMADISPLLACMVFSACYINMTRDKKLYRQINNFTPPIMALFFIVSGMSLELASLRTAGLLGLVYFFVRIIGKYMGAWLSALSTGASPAVIRYLGLALIPQAGVSIGLAFLGRRILPLEVGDMLLTVILASSVLYEMIGPLCAKFAILSARELERSDASQTNAPPQDILDILSEERE